MRRTLIFLSLIFLSGCSMINQSRMFRTGPNYTFKNDPPSYHLKYKLAPGDIFSFFIYSNDGYKIVDIAGGSIGGGIASTLEYTIDFEGKAKLPVLGKVKIAGLSVEEAEKFLEEKYAEYYKSPFAILKILNKRVLVFPGNNSGGSIVYLKNENTSIIEVITMAGGISNSGRAKRVKLIRGDIYNPQVQLLDLSTVQGLSGANMIVQPNDIIYVETAPRISQEILAQISPVISLFSTFLFIYDLTRRK